MPPLPQFSDEGNGMIGINIATGVKRCFSVDNPPTALEIIKDIDHPNFESILAIFKWLRTNNLTLREVYDSQALRQRYANSSYTRIGVSG